MIIGFDGSRAFDKKKTGTENYSYQLLKALAKIDDKNTYIVYIRPNSQARNDNNGWPKNFKFVTIKWSRLWTQGGLAVQTFKDDLNVLYVPAHTLPLIRTPGIKTVVTVHDLGSEFLPSMHQLKQKLYLSIMQRYQLRGASKIIAVSKATKRDLVERIGIEEDKIRVVYEGYDKELFRSVKEEILRNTLKYFDIEEGKYFLFVGTVQPRKNLERIIKAFSIVARDFAASKLVIAGSKGWMSDEVYQLPKKLGIEDKVKFLGYVADKDLPALYSGAKALLFPSLFEGFGLPILEAQACGCPVITSDVSSMTEVPGYVRVNRHVAGKAAILVNPYSIDDIVRGMEKVQSAKWRVQSVKAGFENIKRFSWEKCAKETLKVLLSS